MMMGLYHELIGKSLIGINWTNNGTTGWILPFSQIGLIGIEWKSMRLIRSTELDTLVEDYFPRLLIFERYRETTKRYFWFRDDAVFWQFQLSSMVSD